ncbi:hypothetical protein ACFO4O_10130 [Glaciecola siphonariae]|uniref:Uncharacterized protein n=1 Tax=Glaciecola siphonariae TaxID=521012 RepID=A0ABV9LVH5_9ALTE
MKKLYRYFALAFLTASFVVLANDNIKSLSSSPYQAKKAEDIKKLELRNQQVAFELATVKTMADFQTIEIADSSPLNLLSEDAKARFANSLVFNQRGLAGFYYADLEAELTPTQIYTVLRLFGKQHATHLFSNARIETTLDVMLLDRPISLEDTSEFVAGTNNMPVFGDHKGYYCAGRATCTERQGSICMGSC